MSDRFVFLNSIYVYNKFIVIGWCIVWLLGKDIGLVNYEGNVFLLLRLCFK